MEKIVLYNVDHAKDIIKAAANMRIKSIVVEDDMLSSALKEVLVKCRDYRPEDNISDKRLDKAGLVIFCDVTDKHMDKLLFEMRNGSYKVDYKAVMTKINSQWTIARILAQMERESLEYRQLNK